MRYFVLGPVRMDPRTPTATKVRALLATLPGLRLDASRPAQVRGHVFRKPPTLHARWDAT